MCQALYQALYVSYLRKYGGSPLMIQKAGDGASVVKSLGVASGCLVSNPGPTTYCVTLGKLLKLSVPSSSVKEEKECSENE